LPEKAQGQVNKWCEGFDFQIIHIWEDQKVYHIVVSLEEDEFQKLLFLRVFEGFPNANWMLSQDGEYHIDNQKEGK
jgi:hypothetical protein